MRNYDRSPVTDDPSQFEVADPPRDDARKRRDAETNHPDQPRDEGKPDEPGRQDKDKDGFQQPRHPQGDDTEVDRRHAGRGNLYGEAGRHGRAQDRAERRTADPDDAPRK